MLKTEKCYKLKRVNKFLKKCVERTNDPVKDQIAGRILHEHYKTWYMLEYGDVDNIKTHRTCHLFFKSIRRCALVGMPKKNDIFFMSIKLL